MDPDALRSESSSSSSTSPSPLRHRRVAFNRRQRLQYRRVGETSSAIQPGQGPHHQQQQWELQQDDDGFTGVCRRRPRGGSEAEAALAAQQTGTVFRSFVRHMCLAESVQRPHQSSGAILMTSQHSLSPFALKDADRRLTVEEFQQNDNG